MPCSLTTTQASACTSGIGKVDDPIMLLQVIAQLSSDLLVATAPTSDVTLAAINDRACTTGIGKVTDPIMLLQIIAQNTCQLTP